MDDFAETTSTAATAVTHTGYRCVYCGYDLTGLAIGGSCSECGARIDDSLRRSDGKRTSGLAIASLACGAASVVVCGLLGPVAMILSVKARREIERGEVSPDSSKPLAIVGFVLGAVATGLTVVIVLIYLAMLFGNW